MSLFRPCYYIFKDEFPEILNSFFWKIRLLSCKFFVVMFMTFKSLFYKINIFDFTKQALILVWDCAVLMSSLHTIFLTTISLLMANFLPGF